jgi:hypothetical protein
LAGLGEEARVAAEPAEISEKMVSREQQGSRLRT